MQSETLHATTVAIDGAAVVIEGPPGAGKSDLALRLVDRGAELVADDRTIVIRDGSVLVAHCPPGFAGRIEVRGIGIATLPHRDAVRVALFVSLAEATERLPPPAARAVAGISVRAATIDPRHASAPIRVELALRQPQAVVA